MKHLFRGLLIAILLIGSGISAAFAQQMPPIPVDPNVRVGKLDNGLTYYIRKNSQPENRADFYIAQKVGSIQEEPDQRGLAHFLEHMCFNGTKHFPGDNLKQYLETIGVKFGENLNAYTSIDETVYNISNVPVTREGAIDSCLYILHDWSNDLLLEPAEIDKERGVIHEEWRSRMSGMQRMMEKALPQMYPGTQYAYCMPIGTMDVVLNFKYQTLRDYYEKWYRPDLQGIVIVGDVDVDDIENKIKTIFADIPAQPDAAERIYYPVNNNKEPIIVIEKDKEQPNIQVLIFNKHDAVPDKQKNSMSYLVGNYAKDMIAHMLNARLNELRQTANPPFIAAGGYDGEFFVAKTKDAFTGYAICKEDGIEEGFRALLTEIERIHRFGFTESEYTRARADYLRNLESAYNERDKNKNEQYVNRYVRNFLDNEPIPGIENEYAIMNQIAPAVPVTAVNQMLHHLVTDSNQVVAVFGSEKEGLVYPTKERIAEILKEVKTGELTAYEDKVSDEPLISEMPKAGKIVSEKHDDRFDATVLTLSNGIKVILKKTDFKADEIRMKGVSLGGSSLFPDSEAINILTINQVMEVGGIGNFSTVDLEKVLAGKKASVSAGIGDKTETINGSCSPQDFETLMQLTYLTFTSPRKDTEAFQSYVNRTKAALQNQELHPMVTFIDSINSSVYMNHPRAQRLKSNMVDKISYDKIMDMYKDRFKDASDFTFILVGNVDIDAMKPYIEQYLGALPSVNRKETFKDTKLRARKGVYKNTFEKQQETAKATILLLYNGNSSYNQKNQVLMSMASQILSLIYTEKVREEEGGTYGVSVRGNINKYPIETANLQIMFETDPGKKDRLMEIIHHELQNLATNGPSETNLNKVKEFMLKKHSENLKENNYWLDVIDEYQFTGVDKKDNYEALVNSITANDVRDYTRALISQQNETEVIMVSPEKQ